METQQLAVDARSDRAPTTDVRGLLPGIAGMALVGSSVAVIGALDRAPGLWVQAVRYALAAGCLVVILIGRTVRGSWRLPAVRGRDRFRVAAAVTVGTLSGMVGFNLAVILGSRHAEPAVLGSAVSCIPVVLSIAGPLVRRRRPAARLVLAAAIVAAGAVLVSGWGRTDGIGLLAGLALIVGETGFTLAGAAIFPIIGVWGYSVLTCGAAAVIFGLLAVATGESTTGLLTPHALAGASYLGVVVTALAFVLWLSSVQRVGASASGLVSAVAAPASALVGALFGRPLPEALAWAGMVVIMIGLAAALIAPRAVRS